jgi:hypothetical protein
MSTKKRIFAPLRKFPDFRQRANTCAKSASRFPGSSSGKAAHVQAGVLRRKCSPSHTDKTRDLRGLDTEMKI